MRLNKRDLQIFNLSFLDVVSCGFGAVIMLVLISGTEDYRAEYEGDSAASLLKGIFDYEKRILDMTHRLDALNKQLSAERTRADSIRSTQRQMEIQSASDKAKMEQLEVDLSGLELVQSSLKRASISRDTAMQRDAMVGGIPVDSDYVIFIVDTSGSMKQIWRRVISVLENVLDIHPKVKGFQVLSDNGAYLLAGYSRKWIPDTPARRKSVLRLLRRWNAASNSSPVEGLEVALKTYARTGKNISIYIFGDDYTGSSYDPTLDALDRLNRSRNSDKPLIKVHAIGFVTSHSTNRFGILMREVTKRNRGTFLALPIQ